MPKRPPDRLNTEELEQIKALRASGETYHAIAKRISRDPKTVKKACLEPVAANDIKAKQEKLANLFRDLACRMIANIKDEDIEKINAYQRTVSAAVATDKLRLLSGASTANICIASMVIEAEKKLEQEIKNGSPQ